MDRRALILATGGLLGGAGAAQVLAAGPAAADPAPPVVPVFDVRAYGAVGDGVADDTAAFRAALTAARAVPGGGATLLVPPGSYPLGESLLLGPGMTVQAQGARLFRTGNTSALVKNYASGMPAVTGYQGAGDISVFGGTWDMRGSSFTATCPAFVFTHADGFTLRDVTVLDVPRAHAVELNAVRRARIVDCLFDGVYAGTGTPAVPNRLEAVQITGATDAANLPAPAFDGTPCEDVLISGCVMRNSRPALNSPYDALCGDHYVASGDAHRPVHRNIRVLGNRVESSGAYGVRATDWVRSVIADNAIESAPVNGIYVSSGSGSALQDVSITGNTIRGAGSGGAIVVSNTAAGRNSSVSVSGNLIRSVNGETAIYINQTDGVSITGNTVATTRHPSGGNCQGIQVQRSPHAVITGNHLSDIEGDGIGVDTGSTDALIAQNTVLGATHNGISVASSEAAVRDNRITGAGTGGPAGTYAIRIGGNAVNVSCQGNVARVGEGGGAEAGVGVMAGSQAAWITANDLRGWGTAVRDRGAGTVAEGNLG
ncbi:right-handed parallel beta-helix repeat-containing protein [Streptomyces sp. SID8359]|uniref:right-handed parallel beta-helix repeat-containing protein n=1 Tax=unclassified Streptomyces TaxID=2593676 RepID=UPI00048D9DAC|nr:MULTISPECIES: right-handed parallel beta-helix repeat-containing protein [unclassified Streptomyces]MYT91733.1 right-handed parallel beta-helix repeat-containing protein [Streptomyces sp. SID8359]